MATRRAVCFFGLMGLVVIGSSIHWSPAQVAPANRPSVASSAPTTQPANSLGDPIARIREEGLNHSQAMQTLSYLSDVIGPRLTGSPQLHRANEWTRQTLASWGLSNAHLEAWGPFGRGWSLKRFAAQVIEPQAIPLVAFPKAWSPGLEQPLTADVVQVDAQAEADLAKYAGKLKGKIVLVGGPREIAAHFDPQALRANDADLLRLANADVASAAQPGLARAMTPADRRAMLEGTPAGRLLRRGGEQRAATTQPTSGPATRRGGRVARAIAPGRLIEFLQSEGAALVVSPSTQGDGGTIFVAAAAAPGEELPGRTRDPKRPRPWSADAPAVPPQIVIAAEQYNRLLRLLDQHETVRMAVDLQVQFHGDNLMAYNTIAEIPGSDLKDQIVMLGAHMDSWHSGTGATDNGIGVAAVMEAVRIVKALHLQPRRTIRVALWTGEEQGLFGSRAYVKQHFGYFPESTESVPPQGARPTSGPAERMPATQPSRGTSRPARELVRGPEFDRLSVYFNLDNGAGRIRGVYLQGNEAVRPIFRRWLAPFADLSASTLSLANTGSTDHVSFDAIGLPGFQFIQDPLEYMSRTHHSNADVFDRIQPDDLTQAATILAAFAYDAAMLDERLPRKPPTPPPARTGVAGPASQR